MISDPNLLQCPDYELPEHAQTLALLINAHTLAPQALQLLKNIWHMNNGKDKAAWQLQLDTDVAETEARRQQEVLDSAARDDELAQERDALDKEERKRNKDKYTHIPLDLGIPMQPHDVPSMYAIRKLEKSHYLELWYLTNDGLDSARRTNATADADTMVVVRNDDNTTSWQTNAQPARGVLDDEDLPWEAVCNACPLLVKAAADAGWTDERIDILAGFFGGILTHRWRSSRDPLELKALQVYMAEQRRLWHIAILKKQGYNLSIFNEALLRDTYERVYRQNRNTLDARLHRPNPYVQSPLV